MVQPNNSATSGDGSVLATHLVNSKEYQTVTLADDTGHIMGSRAGYILMLPPLVPAASKLHADLFNATGSGKTMYLEGIWARINADVAAVGVLAVRIDLFRTTAVGTGGTAATNDGGLSTSVPSIVRTDPSDSVVPAQVTARSLPTGGATTAGWFNSSYHFNEETNAATYVNMETNLLGTRFDAPFGPKIVIPENNGILIKQGPVANAVGLIGFKVVFSLA